MNLPTKALLGVLFLGLSTVAQAQLTWEKTEIELNPAPGTDSIVATFKYENKGNTVVNIKGRAHLLWLHHRGLEKERRRPRGKG